MPEDNTSLRYKSSVKYLAYTALVVSIGLYILSFTLPGSFFQNRFLSLLLPASATIPVLFLFSLVIPNLISNYIKEDDYLQMLYLTLVITVVVLISTSFLLLPIESNNFIGFLTFMVPSVLAVGVFVIFSKLTPLVKRILLAVGAGILVSPYIGFWVNLAYYWQIKNIQISPWSGPTYYLKPTFGLIDLILLSIVSIVLLLFTKKQFRKWSVLPNILFVFSTLVYLFVSRFS